MPIYWFILTAFVLLLALATLILARVALLAVKVERTSMSPTLEEGDRVLVCRYFPSWWLRKGQIVILWPWLPASKGQRLLGSPDFVPYIKRVIALPGDTLVTPLTDLAERYRSEQRAAYDSGGRRTWHIPPGHIFVRSDNPLGGVDSLIWGPVPSKTVLGIVIMRLPHKAQVTGAKSFHSSMTAQAQLSAGQDAPDFTAETLSGETVSLANYFGRTVVFLFVSPCRLCQEAIAGYEVVQPYAMRAGLEFVLVSDSNAEQTRAFVSEINTSLPVLIAPQANNPFMRDYKAKGVPSYCIVDAQGKVQSAGYPSLEWGQWKALVELWKQGEGEREGEKESEIHIHSQATSGRGW